VHSAITKLLSISSEPIGEPLAETSAIDAWGTLGNQLMGMLRSKNGFFAYESALLVRPLRRSQSPLGILEWNAPERWKIEFSIDLGDALFFAEDVFGGQYCIRNDTICTFDPEGGVFQTVGTSLDAWATEVTRDYPFRTGFPLAHDWQMAHGPIAAGMRLIPKTPFVLGGRFDVDNLYPLLDVEGMRFRASIANQIRELPDGSEIVFKKPSGSSRET
jgi:hypothetical protein